MKESSNEPRDVGVFVYEQRFSIPNRSGIARFRGSAENTGDSVLAALDFLGHRIA